ncbi:MAG: RIP metalloprotease RseP, partial [Candidatus Omnitrophica bacterium]|nr:RIP metalloprotease RseP [Candidatus Omnitrophota bacterium]
YNGSGCVGARGGESILFNMILSVLPTIFVLGILITIHELGHFICAKAAGVNVEKFSIGFGPEIVKVKRAGTVYALSLIPLGGFVKMAGETFDEREGVALKPDDFLAQKPMKRFWILFAGSFMNYVLAFVLLIFVFIAGAPTIGTTVGDVLKDSPAEQSGLKNDDKILSIDGVEVNEWTEMTDLIQNSDGQLLDIKVRRAEDEVNIRLQPKKVETKDIFGDVHIVYQIGVASGSEIFYTRYPALQAFGEAWQALMRLTALTYKSIFRLITGRLSLKVMSGPLGIIDMASKTAKQGMIPLFQLTAYIGVFLAVFNLLPIPALDGGHLFFLLLEVIWRKPVSFHVQERLTQVGFVLLMCLMAFVVYNDIDRFGWIDALKDLIVH